MVFWNAGPSRRLDASTRALASATARPFGDYVEDPNSVFMARDL
jgi:hypothetical protein